MKNKVQLQSKWAMLPLFMLPWLMQAQHLGGSGRGDDSERKLGVTLNGMDVSIIYFGGPGRGDHFHEKSGVVLEGKVMDVKRIAENRGGFETWVSGGTVYVRSTLGRKETLHARLYDLSGRNVWQGTLSFEGLARGEELASVPMGSHASGVYLLYLHTGSGQELKPVKVVL